MNFMMVFLFFLALITFAINGGSHFDDYLKYERQNDNYKAIGHRNKAFIYGLLCIIFIIAFACNREEFHLSNNQFNNCPMSEQSNDDSSPAMACSWAVLEHGSTVARVKQNYAGILPLSLVLLFKRQATRIKAVRFEFESNKVHTFVTRTYNIKSLPAIEQYLS